MERSLSRNDGASAVADLILCTRGRSWNTLRRMLKDRRVGKALLMSRDPESGSFLLHLACKHDAPCDIVQEILSIAPESSQQLDQKGMLPLHRAVANTAHLGVVLMLLREYKEGACIYDDKGILPLHIACRAYAREPGDFFRSLIELLLASFPGAVYVADIYGNLPCTYFTKFEDERDPTVSERDMQLGGVLLNDCAEDNTGKHRKTLSGSFHWWESDILADRIESPRKCHKGARQA